MVRWPLQVVSWVSNVMKKRRGIGSVGSGTYSPQSEKPVWDSSISLIYSQSTKRGKAALTRSTVRRISAALRSTRPLLGMRLAWWWCYTLPSRLCRRTRDSAVLAARRRGHHGLTTTSPTGPRNIISKRFRTSRPRMRSLPTKSLAVGTDIVAHPAVPRFEMRALPQKRLQPH